MYGRVGSFPGVETDGLGLSCLPLRCRSTTVQCSRSVRTVRVCAMGDTSRSVVSLLLHFYPAGANCGNCSSLRTVLHWTTTVHGMGTSAAYPTTWTVQYRTVP